MRQRKAALQTQRHQQVQQQKAGNRLWNLHVGLQRTSEHTKQKDMPGLQGLTRGKLSVAVLSTDKYFVPKLLGTFCAAHPRIDISLAILNREGVVQRLRHNQDDFCLMSMPPPVILLENRVLMANPLQIIATKRSMLANPFFCRRMHWSWTAMRPSKMPSQQVWAYPSCRNMPCTAKRKQLLFS
jgi:DNA-binding transcriptional LysR family regulator